MIICFTFSFVLSHQLSKELLHSFVDIRICPPFCISYYSRLSRTIYLPPLSFLNLRTFFSPFSCHLAALNKLLGKEVYTSQDQLGGPQIMFPNGVTHEGNLNRILHYLLSVSGDCVLDSSTMPRLNVHRVSSTFCIMWMCSYFDLLVIKLLQHHNTAHHYTAPLYSCAERQGRHAGSGWLAQLHTQGFPLHRPTHPQRLRPSQPKG